MSKRETSETSETSAEDASLPPSKRQKNKEEVSLHDGEPPAEQQSTEEPMNDEDGLPQNQKAGGGLSRAGTMAKTAADALEFLGSSKELLETGQRETRARSTARAVLDQAMVCGSEDNHEDGEQEKMEIDQWDEEKERQKFKLVFYLIDNKKAGVIQEEQVAGILRSLGKTPEKAKIRQLVKELDKDGTGSIKLADFVSHMVAKRRSKLSDEAKQTLAAREEASASQESGRGRSKSPTRGRSKSPVAKKSKKAPTSKSPVKKTTTSKSPVKKAAPKKAVGSLSATKASSPRKSKKKPSDFFSPLAFLQIGDDGKDSNPSDSKYDLGLDGAFTGFSIYVYATSMADDLQVLKDIATQKKIELHCHDSIIQSVLEKSSALVVISNCATNESFDAAAFGEAVATFHKTGRGVALLSVDGFSTEISAVLEHINGGVASDKEVTVNDDSSTLLKLSESELDGATSAFGKHMIFSGLRSVQLRGKGISFDTETFDSFKAIAINSHASPSLLIKEMPESWPPTGRVVLDASASKYFQSAEVPDDGSRRLLANILVWLLAVDFRLASNAALSGSLATATDYIWQYFHSGWYSYDQEGSEIVEKYYQEYLLNPAKCDVRSVQSGFFHYMVDFVNLKQINVDHSNHTQRKIRRVPKNFSVV